MGATVEPLAVTGEARPGVGDVPAPVSEEAASDSGGEIMVEYRLRSLLTGAKVGICENDGTRMYDSGGRAGYFMSTASERYYY